MCLQKSDKRGFTLIEVIVVLTILAILAAIIIPAMTGWIDKAQDKRLVVACRTCVVAAQTLASEKYGMSGAGGVNVTGSEVIDLAKIPGSVPSLALDSASAVVNTLTYQSDAGEAMTYYRDREPHYQLGGGSAATGFSTNAGAVGRAVQNLLEIALNTTINGTTFKTTIDSTCTDNAGAGFTKLMQPAVDALGLGAMNIQSWSLQREYNVPIVFVTDQKIADLQAGDRVRTIRYNPSKNTYTAGYMTLGYRDSSKSYLTMLGGTGANWTEYSPKDKQTAATKASADATVEIFNSMPEKP